MDAIAIPARERGVTIDPQALDRLAAESAGYPFFVQEYASAAWLAHRGNTITAADVEGVIPGVRRILEDDFYDSRFRRLTPRECAYVLALAELGPGAHTSREIAERFGTTSETLSSIRNQLVKKDVLYSPVSGMAEFRIPLTERYVLEHKPELERRARGSTVQRRPPVRSSSADDDSVAIWDANCLSASGEVVHGGLDFVAGGAGGGAFAAQGGFDEQHCGAEGEHRRVGGGDLADNRALGGVALAA